MTIALSSKAELQAQKCESLPAFSGLNLLHIKTNAAQLLSLIGRDGIFDQYTIHDIQHIDRMLISLDWIVPEDTKSIMSPADWLMTVLSIYFHDLGMLASKQEFDSRNESEFPKFKTEFLFAGPNGPDYEAKVRQLNDERAERFLYQEFIRHKHAERIRMWITGQPHFRLGNTGKATEEITKLLSPVGFQFKKDLGMVCESHHLDDLNDLKKYKPSQPYGNSDKETANLQYCAVLLRTADLLHVTSDRTPSTTFRAINPSDPISQEEWAKQMAVRSVRAKIGLDKDNIPDELEPKDTIEIHASFREESGFFGLTSYLAYTGTQLKKSHEWVQLTNKLNAAKHTFPWRKIDDTNIETEGFLRDTFEFTIDQGKILDLLTGHTLYNDLNVVLRELAQNAIDAVRLQFHPHPARVAGKVIIEWNSKSRTMTVTDNGTGMSQQTISNFLLKVGNSRYQDPDFVKSHPNFSSISRFGIGVLSAFMIADSVEIFTCSSEDDQARHLTLRSVHGKYLIRLLDKSNELVKNIFPNGTQFSLKLRPSVKMPDVLQSAKQWIVTPDCEVTVIIDNEAPIRVGFDTPAEALINSLSNKGISADLETDSNDITVGLRDRQVRVIQRTSNNVTVAYAVQWNSFFQEWAFLNLESAKGSDSDGIFLGTCIEGIRVEFGTPGFKGDTIVALADVKGASAPKTNVARSGIEATSEKDTMLASIYDIYRSHIEREIEELSTNRSFSLTWAIDEALYLISPLFSEEFPPSNRTIFDKSFVNLKILIVEKNEARYSISASELSKESEFWTIDCALFESAEVLIREADTSSSLSTLMNSLKLSSFQSNQSPVLCGSKRANPFANYALKNREVSEFIVNEKGRKIDLKWVDRSLIPRWRMLPSESERILFRRLGRFAPYSTSNFFIGSHDIKVNSEKKITAIKTSGSIFLLPQTHSSDFLLNRIDNSKTNSTENVIYLAALGHIIINCFELGPRVKDINSLINRSIRLMEDDYGHITKGLTSNLEHLLDRQSLVELITNTEWHIFDPSKWTRIPSESGMYFE